MRIGGGGSHAKISLGIGAFKLNRHALTLARCQKHICVKKAFTVDGAGVEKPDVDKFKDRKPRKSLICAVNLFLSISHPGMDEAVLVEHGRSQVFAVAIEDYDILISNCVGNRKRAKRLVCRRIEICDEIYVSHRVSFMVISGVKLLRISGIKRHREVDHPASLSSISIEGDIFLGKCIITIVAHHGRDLLPLALKHISVEFISRPDHELRRVTHYQRAES